MTCPGKTDITFARGDTFPLKISVKFKSTQEYVDFAFDDVYFTVKKNFTDTNYKFQKRLSDGTITADQQTGCFHVKIMPADTDGLSFGQYVYDVEVVKGTAPNVDIKKTLSGNLYLTNESTHASNEV